MTPSWELIIPFIVLDLVLIVTALISCVKEEHTRGPKWLWILIILFISILGPVLYFVFGRPKRG
ncbi:PLDc N-terminal domain-containing protein [Siminovitchia sp. FSL W7-1587]|uniref:PLDc N-terminal domain-containing protein n=1 Tax=Siminovitchia sp. FSL W7-1587 TaxID=2954699 RepID=UPI0030D5FD0D